MLNAFSASKFVRKLIFSFSALVVLLPISAKGQPLPDSARFNQNTSVLNDFGLDSAADLENIGNSVEPLPVLSRQESDFSPARPTPLVINVPSIWGKPSEAAVRGNITQNIDSVKVTKLKN